MMEKTLTLPRLGETMEEGTVLAWSKISGEEYDRIISTAKMLMRR